MVGKEISRRQIRKQALEELVDDLAYTTQIDPERQPLEAHDITKHTAKNPVTLYRSTRHPGDKL